MQTHRSFRWLLAGSAWCAAAVWAQAPAPIDKIQLNDGGLTCPQIQEQVQAMDRVVAEAQAAQSSGQTQATAGQAAGVAAEVASRTGLFGALGGLGGHLLGSVASKTAAGVVAEKGATGAAHAQARQQQAQARKEHLAQLYLSKGCGGAAPVPMPVPDASAPAVMPPPPVFDTPQLTVIHGDRLKGVHRVAVASFTVQFVESQVGEVVQRANLGSNGVTSLTEYTSRAVGVDFSDALQRDRMQAATNTLYQDFLNDLKASGLDVVPPETLHAAASYQAFARQGGSTPRVEDAEAQKSSGQGAIRSVFMAPPGVPLVIKGGSGAQSIDYLNTGSSLFSPTVRDHTLTFTGNLSLGATNFLFYEKDVQKEFDTATLHVRVFVPLAVIEVDHGTMVNWTKAKITPGVLLGNRFTRMTVGVQGDYSYVFLKDDFKVPGVIEYTVQESPHPNPVRALVGEKVKTYPSTLYVDRYWRDVPEAARVVFKSFVGSLKNGGT